MSYVLTYSKNDDYRSFVPFALSDTSRPRLEDIENWRNIIYELINERLNGAAADLGGLRHLEIRKVLLMLDNYYARGRGERTESVVITEDDLTSLRLNSNTSGDGYGGGHYSLDIPF